MSNILAGLLKGSAIAGAALLVSACGSSEKAQPIDTNVLDSNIATEALDNGTVSDITATDATLGAEANMTLTNDVADNVAAPDAVVANAN